MRHIKIDQEFKDQLVNNFKTYIESLTTIPAKLEYSTECKLPIKEKAQLIFAPDAYLKFSQLMLENTLEVGWHGLVEKTGEHTFLLKDIIVYPQEVSAVSIIPDADEYAQWLMALDDETFPLVRYHGHSHVNMGITPSSIDTDFRDDITLHLKENDFYIFHIANKKNQHHIEIYDTTLNILYTPADVEISIVLNDGTPVKIWQQETTKLVRTYTKPIVTQIPIIQQAIHDGYRPEDKTAITKLNKKKRKGYQSWT